MGTLSYELVSALARCDAPTLATDLIFQLIIDRPASSSWNRRFLSLGFIKYLPPKGAGSMLLSLATALGEKLEEQSCEKVGETELTASAPPRSLVKVATVKYLAQLLRETESVHPD